jgi:hypothetical protein
MREHRSDVTEIDAEITEAVRVLRDALAPVDGSEVDTALCSVETFIVIALRVFSKTNPSKLRSETRTVEIKARLDGIRVIQGAA